MSKYEPAFSGRDPDITNTDNEADVMDWWLQVEASRAEERKVLENILEKNLQEQRRARRGKNWFRVFIALYLLSILWLGNTEQWQEMAMPTPKKDKKHTAVVDIQGPIMAAANDSADNIIKGLNKAFTNPDTAGVILRINSPGGSPVQAGQVYDEVVRLHQRYPDIPFYAALEDLCASGGYYIAAGVPTIYADKATLVGSIGVILQGFGFQESLNKLGMESRLLTSGKNKAFLNPFSPQDATEKAHAQTLLDKIHQQFIEAVRKGRDKRLKTEKTELFEGLIWTGEEAVELGLVDGLGSATWIAREKIKHERLVNFTHKNDWLSRMSKQMGIDLSPHFNLLTF